MIEQRCDQKKSDRANTEPEHAAGDLDQLHLPARAAQLTIDVLVVLNILTGGRLFLRRWSGSRRDACCHVWCLRRSSHCVRRSAALASVPLLTIIDAAASQI